MRRCLRDKHYSLRTERVYVYLARWYICFHGLRHPTDMGTPEIHAFLSYLANCHGWITAAPDRAGASAHGADPSGDRLDFCTNDWNVPSDCPAFVRDGNARSCGSRTLIFSTAKSPSGAVKAEKIGSPCCQGRLAGSILPPATSGVGFRLFLRTTSLLTLAAASSVATICTSKRSRERFVVPCLLRS